MEYTVHDVQEEGKKSPVMIEVGSFFSVRQGQECELLMGEWQKEAYWDKTCVFDLDLDYIGAHFSKSF